MLQSVKSITRQHGSRHATAGRSNVACIARIAIYCGLAALALAGCHAAQTLRGAALPAAAPLAIASLASTHGAAPVVVQGEMTEKCPVAGCWFMLKDSTGVVRVDTKSAGFVVSDVPVHTHITVAGKVTHGAEAGIAATGIRF